jgi:hypothetical protein
MTLNVLLEPSRAARLANTGMPGFDAVTDALLDATWKKKTAGGMAGAIERQTERQVMYALLGLAFNPAADGEVRAIALAAVGDLDNWLSRQSPKDAVQSAHYGFARSEIERLRKDPSQLSQLAPVVIPPGSPIGSYSSQY